ncbi:transcriptional regulator, IclR family [Modicisalibacter ilicicola DSM 19980]|uniref:Transcriptional regulator, IclR family n=1 Tax=Modicisalibacter ilicicola DSM 19980 TaxID=1121942 RepID=A0A1M4YI97_9GAMM|nr:helix-turn-helix domain-containing protein [Halomonas ilicicola]SHF05411.1 transcriptional regulator, IclR family [Halomonas ilicicola DSM 19980]
MAQDRVEAVERALTILEAFDATEECFTLAELANATGFYKSTLLRLLGSLERFDYVQRGGDGRYRLGPTPWRLARRHLPSRRLEARVQPVLDALAAASGETATLIAVTGESAECRLVATPDSALRHELYPGQRWPAPAGVPTLDFAGGVMICRRVTSTDSETLWLAVSGPQGRLDSSSAEAHLDTALSKLSHRAVEVTPSTLSSP